MTYPRRTIGRRRSDRFRMAIGLGLGLVLLGLVLQLSRCNATRVSGPDPTPDTPQQAVATPAPSPAATPAAAPAVPPTSQTEVDFGSNASWSVKNTSDIRQHYTAYWTDFDNQDLSRGSQEGQFNPGDTFSGSFGRGCLQLDLTNGAAGDVPFAYAYYDQNGAKVRTITAEIRAACAPKCAEPKEHRVTYGDEVWNTTPLEGRCLVVEDSIVQLNCHNAGTQTRTTDFICSQDTNETIQLCRNVECPCVPQDITRTTTEYGPWSNLENECGTRTKTVTTYHLNSCTQVETHDAPVVTTDTKECPCVEQNPNNTKTYSTPVWSGTNEPGTCPPQSGPHATAQDPPQCHESGTQAWTIDRSCSNDTTGSDPVCRAVQCAGACYYNVDGDNASAEEASCKNAGGIWLNFVQGALHNHCQFAVPGVSLCDFQLTPGQSDESCLSKPKHGCNN